MNKAEQIIRMKIDYDKDFINEDLFKHKTYWSSVIGAFVLGFIAGLLICLIRSSGKF